MLRNRFSSNYITLVKIRSSNWQVLNKAHESISFFSVAKATLHSPMSVSLTVAENKGIQKSAYIKVD